MACSWIPSRISSSSRETSPLSSPMTASKLTKLASSGNLSLMYFIGSKSSPSKGSLGWLIFGFGLAVTVGLFRFSALNTERTLCCDTIIKLDIGVWVLGFGVWGLGFG